MNPPLERICHTRADSKPLVPTVRLLPIRLPSTVLQVEAKPRMPADVVAHVYAGV